MAKYQAIFFDLDHTLLDTHRQYALGLELAIQKIYHGNVPEDFVARFRSHHDALWALYDRREMTMPELRRQRFIRAWQDYGVVKTVEEADAFQEVYDNTYEETMFPYPGTIEMLEALANSHQLGVVTNGSPDVQWRKMRIAGVQRFFDESAVIISEHIGKAKPHPTVYQAACDALGVTAKQSLMIGDNFTADYEGAIRFGMDAVWYVPDPTMPGEHQGRKALRNTQEVLQTIAKMEQARLV